MKNKNFLIKYQYAVGLTLGLLIGAWMGEDDWEIFYFIVLLWMIVIAERIFK